MLVRRSCSKVIDQQLAGKVRPHLPGSAMARFTSILWYLAHTPTPKEWDLLYWHRHGRSAAASEAQH
ncbi:hypothetical protein ABZP36_002002 [Zizania latifolia]